MGYIYDISHRYGKLALEKKVYLYKILKIFKGYVLLGEHSNGIVTEKESHNVDFIDNEFSSRDKVDRSLKLHEIVDQEEMAPRGLVESEEEIHQAITDFESNLSLSGSTPLVNQPQQPQLHRSTHESVHHRRFEIKKKAYMVVSHYDDEPRTIYEALLSFTK